MNKKILFLILLAVVLVLPFVAHAQTKLQDMAGQVKTVAIAVGNAVVIIGWVIAGILWLTAAGSPEKLKIAKSAIFACVVGTLLVVLADSAKILEVIKDAFNLGG